KISRHSSLGCFVIDSHGLFASGDEPLVLAQAARAVSAHSGNVWIPIIFLRREVRTGVLFLLYCVLMVY
ncbi:MAG: hypothetical protein RSG86_07705, partial [Oscillospiraceae bacterium]